MHYPAPVMVTKPCDNCSTLHTVRVVDVKRGWGRFCSKSCKAQHQTAKGGRKAQLQVKSKKQKETVKHEDSFAEYDAIVAREESQIRKRHAYR